MGRLQLKVTGGGKDKGKPPAKADLAKVNIFKDTQLYYSGFCLTDQKNFALFFVTPEFLKKQGLSPDLPVNFDLSADDLNMEFNSAITAPEVTFDDQGRFLIYPQADAYVRYEHWHWFRTNYPNMVVHPITTFFGRQVYSLWVVLQEAKGRPVGILNLHPMHPPKEGD